MKKIVKYLVYTFIVFSVTTLLVIMFVEGKDFHDSIFITLMLFGGGEPLNLDIHSLGWTTGFFMIGQTLLGLASLTIAFGLLANYLMSERIAKLMAREKINMKDHVILCGLGNVGYNVVKELDKLNQPFVILDRGDDKDLLDLCNRKGYKILVENLKQSETLELAGIADAKSIIICTGNDLLNMEVALNARAKRPDIIIVMRMFDQQLAHKVADAFDIKVAFSASKLAAPVFAAASFDRAVFQSTRVEQELFVSAQIDIASGSELVGMSIDELMKKELVVLKLISGEERLKFPTGDRPLRSGDRLYITCSLETLKEVKALNKDK